VQRPAIGLFVLLLNELEDARKSAYLRQVK